MKTTIAASPLLDSNNMDVSIMGMDAAGMRQAAYFMRDKIYTDKILAVVREYACNAIDEHKKFGIEKPVQIGLRQEGQDIVFFVRDFANGLSTKDIREVFGMYFHSTKTGSNDSIGGFGIGSKSGHCYSDTFFVSSYFQGEKKTYTCMLGGDDEGVPIGHIYEIDCCSTNESGLEVSLPIDKKDYELFHKKILSFIDYSPANIKYTHLLDETEHFPSETVSTKQIEGFNFRYVKQAETSESFDIIFKMGGVTYLNKNIDFVDVNDAHRLVVDIPIGMMSIPTSRESFEQTASNRAILEKIENIIIEWCKKDLAKFKDVGVIDLLQDKLVELTLGSWVSGEIFCAKKMTLFSTVWPIVANIHMSNVGENTTMELLKGLPVLVLIPKGYKRSNYWQGKVSSYSKSVNKNYYTVCENRFNQSSQEGKLAIAQEMTVISARKLPYPKLTKDKRRYSVNDNRRNIGTFNALELHNHMRDVASLPKASNEQEALEQNNEAVKFAKNINDLNKIVIYRGSSNRHTSYYSNSAIFVSVMESVGFLAYGSKQYCELREKFQVIEAKEDAKKSTKNQALRPFLLFSQKTIDLINKNHKNAQRVADFWHEIKEGNSLRSKIIRTSDTYYGKLTREEFRTIMKLK